MTIGIDVDVVIAAICVVMMMTVMMMMTILRAGSRRGVSDVGCNRSPLSLVLLVDRCGDSELLPDLFLSSSTWIRPCICVIQWGNRLLLMVMVMVVFLVLPGRLGVLGYMDGGQPTDMRFCTLS